MAKQKDDFFVEVGKRIQEDEAKHTIVSVERVRQVREVEAAVKDIIEGGNMKVSAKIGDPFPSFGAVEISGKELRIKDLSAFARQLDKASNVEFGSNADKTVQINFGFHGLTR